MLLSINLTMGLHRNGTAQKLTKAQLTSGALEAELQVNNAHVTNQIGPQRRRVVTSVASQLLVLALRVSL